MRSHLGEKECLSRANGALARVVVWGGLGVCALGASVYDIGRWMTAW
jgi:hypothetical protein